jgi:hypothetical protein
MFKVERDLDRLRNVACLSAGFGGLGDAAASSSRLLISFR